MRVLVVGSGGREHALAWACRRSPNVTDVICAPGNGGTDEIATNVEILATDPAAIAALAKTRRCDLVIVGPDAALAAGVADACQAEGIAVLGPSAAAAQIESSKQFAKQVMAEAAIPTAAWLAGDESQISDLLGFARERDWKAVVKADGLALGKGVTLCNQESEVRRALDECLTAKRFGDAGASVVIEEQLSGREVSLFAICDGQRSVMLPAACDYKRAYDGDAGPNTGGMGAYSPPMGLDIGELCAQTNDQVVAPTLARLRDRGTPFIGCLYVGLMLTSDGMRVLEYNARFGDPETQAVLPRLDESVVELFFAAANGSLGSTPPREVHRAAVTVVAAQTAYPGDVPKNLVVELPKILPDDALLFHAGTARHVDGRLRMNGGRVFGVTGLGDDLSAAHDAAYELIDALPSGGLRWRTDIAAQ